MTIFCQSCGYPSTHPLGLYINDQGVCSGCITHDEKFTLDWSAREAKLFELVNPYRSKGNCSYDCIVPINGGTDSYYTLYYVKYILKMKPLCVAYNSLYMTRLGHRNLANLRSKFNIDIHIHTPSLQQVRDINRATLYNLNSMYWHVHAGSTSLPVHISIKYKIPLIIWGGHEAVEQVGMYSHCDNVEMSARYRENHHLMQTSMLLLENQFLSLRNHNNSIYHYPDYNLIEKYSIRGIYLSNYIPWNQKIQQELMSRKFHYRVTKYSNTFNGYEHPHCAFYNGIHDWLKYLQFGYGRLLDHLVREIRWKRISLSSACFILSDFLNPTPPLSNIRLFQEYMDLSTNSIDFLFDSAKNSVFFPSSDNPYTSSIYNYLFSNFSHLESNIDYDDLIGSYTNAQCFSSSSKPYIFLPGFPF